MIALIVLTLVFILIAVRRIGRLRLQIWQIMLLGASIVLVTGQIPVGIALRAINLDVMAFLFGMFVVGQAMEESGYLSHLAYRMFGRARTGSSLLLAILVVMALLSALLMNDTVAIIGTPVALSLARYTGIRPQPLLIALACAVTVGSVASPIGNPQNLLVVVYGNMQNPFVTFGRYLVLPTLVSLLLLYGVLRVAYRHEFGRCPVAHVYAPVSDPALARLCRVSLAVLVSMLAIKVALVAAGVAADVRLTYIALLAALPILIGSNVRAGLIRRIDWTTLVFFAAMFVLMQSVWLSGYLQAAIAAMQLDIASPGVIMLTSILASQALSNVPLTALYLPLLHEVGAATQAYMALAAGATIAGMLTIPGAASNVIIIQNAEKRAGSTLTFIEFARVGIPATAICSAVYWIALVA